MFARSHPNAGGEKENFCLLLVIMESKLKLVQFKLEENVATKWFEVEIIEWNLYPWSRSRSRSRRGLTCYMCALAF